MAARNMRLQSALDNEIHLAIQKFLADGVPVDSNALYSALQKSNSSLKRKPKKLLVSSIERVIDVMGIPASVEDEYDSATEVEKRLSSTNPDADVMNKALRSNLSSTPLTTRATTPVADELPKKRRLPNGEPVPIRSKPDKIPTAAPSNISLHDVGGMADVIEQMGDLLIQPLMRPETYLRMNLPLPRGILLHGPPGCGKTMLTRAFAALLDVPFIEILGPSIVSSMSGDSEKGIRERFEEAKKNAPCLIFIDELDAIAPKRDSSQSQMEKRIVAQLLVCIDDLGRDYEKPVIVLAATNRPDSLDPALRRGGRFDTEINITVPNEQVREQVLRAQTRNTPLAPDVDLKALAKLTAGFVGSDLHDLIGKAGSWQMRKYREALRSQTPAHEAANGMNVDEQNQSTRDLLAISRQERLVMRWRERDMPEPAGFESLQISMDAFLAVLPTITPSSKREGFATIPDVSWDDIGALKDVRERLQMAIVRPIQHPDQFKALAMKSSAGVLLWGPPGCGKTLLAKAAAAESKANFISVRGPELLSKYVGESEAAVRRVFTRARSSVPCIVFFDEIDALAPKRDEASSEATARVVNTLLSELDGLNERAGIYIIGATNRPDIIDNAMLRPGRLETSLFVDLPGPEERVEILNTMMRGKAVDREGIPGIARKCDGFSGADLGALLHSAGCQVIRRGGYSYLAKDFEVARQEIVGSVTDIEEYYRLRKKFGRM